MNERIKKLRKQAIDFCLDKGSQGNLSEEVSEKFAELIVLECIVDFYRRYLDICSDEDITVQVERYVKEYFGVK